MESWLHGGVEGALITQNGDGKATPRRLYRVRVRPVGDEWSITVYGLNRGRCQTPTLEGIHNTARDLIALVLNVPTDSFDLEVQVFGQDARYEDSPGTRRSVDPSGWL